MPPTEQQTYADPQPPSRFRGPIILFALFCASACTTVLYLSSASASQGQTAAAAYTIPDAFQQISLEAESVYVMDLTSGRVLYEKNAGVQLPLASLTKVALALAVTEVLPADYVITIPYDTAPRGSAMRLGKGEAWKVRDVVNFTLIASSNSGAEILASAADESLRAVYPDAPRGSATLWRMNDMARSLGLTATYFLNVSGLDISTTQAGAYGSARDMAKLFSFAATNHLAAFAGTTQGGILLTSENGATTSALNTNQALGSIPGLVMGKTGLTDLAGGNLAIVFDVGVGHPVVAVVMHSSEKGRFEDMKTIVAAAMEATSQN